MEKMAFIGGGNMAAAIIGGLVTSGRSPETITVVDPNQESLQALISKHGILGTQDVTAACKEADVIILAVKPQIITAVASQLETDLSGKLLLSIAAGVTISELEDLFGTIAIARTMPNTPALLRLGATGLFLNEKATQPQRASAKAILNSFGICVTVEREELLDAVTAVSGSGPAYYFLMIEEMIKSGISLGLSSEDATALTLQTALGAANMAAQGDVSAEELRKRVTSPNGTTHAAIVEMQNNAFGDVIFKAMTACRDRAIELGQPNKTDKA